MDIGGSRASCGGVTERGIFISFEGVDGCGKSTQIKELRRRLRSLGDRVVLTREPGGTVLGEDIRKLLQRAVEGPDMTDRAELLLFMASRAELVSQVLEPALKEGKCIIADRFLDSSTIYQGVARGLDPDIVARINRFAVGDCLPDVTFLMDLDPQQARARLQDRGQRDRIESLPDTFFADVREGYLALAEQEPKRFVVIPATAKVGAISDTIWNVLTQRFNGFFG